ncbi:hypothetical protein WA026_019768 [Henosepilachna vigintioctopunctata]|uniref:Odorant receptor n=1 Tax=Henosepilachna vigintioctopunctata TaxID=420089 RepID=A0AAW1UF82_9CUCU
MVRHSLEESDVTTDIYEKLLHIKGSCTHAVTHRVSLQAFVGFSFKDIMPSPFFIQPSSSPVLDNCQSTRHHKIVEEEVIAPHQDSPPECLTRHKMTICLNNALIIGVPVVNVALNFQNNLIPIELTEKKTQKIILHQIKLLKCFIYPGALCAAVAACLFATDNEYNDNKVYFFTITRKITWMNLGQVLSIYCRLSYFFLALVTIANAYLVSYIGLHSNYQLIVLQNFIDHVCDSNCTNEENLYYDETSQRIITQRMKICIMIYQSIYSGVENFVKMIYNVSVLVLVGVLFIGGGVMLELFRESEIQSSFALVFFISLAGASNGLLYIIVGQAIKDEIFRGLYSVATILSRTMGKTNK